MAVLNGMVQATDVRTCSALGLFEAMQDPVLVADQHALIVDLNPAAERFFGYRREELLTTALIALASDAGPLCNAIRPTLERYGTWQGELQVRTRHQGLRTVCVTLQQVASPGDDGKMLTLAICHDMKARKRLEATLSLQTDELSLQTEERVTADRRKNEFIAILSHELRNPLAPITNALALMRNRGISDPLLASSHAIIERQIGHLRQMVNGLVDVARLNNGRVKLTIAPLLLQDVVEQALEITLPKIRAAGHTLTQSIAPAPIAINGDQTRLVQALANVLNNAAKFTPKGGTIDVTCSKIGGAGRIVVRDSGAGISAEFLPRVFEAFSQVDESLARNETGIGVGLAISNGIMMLHGGSITARSDGIGCGSELTLQLPLAREGAALPTSEAHMESGKATNQGFRILLIDDNNDANESMAALLELMNYDVRTARDGASALAMTTQFEPQLILSDIGLPGMDGYELAPALRLASGSRKLILVAATGYGNANDRQRSQAAGFDYHLVKPLDADSLLEFLARQAADF